MINAHMEDRLSSFILYGSVIAVLVFFYLPILTLVTFSFQDGRYLTFPIEVFSLRWYGALFEHPGVWEATKNSLLIAVCAGLVSTASGVFAALAWARGKLPFKLAFQALTISPLLFPQLLMGVVLLLWFSVLGNLFDFSTGLLTAIAGHVVYLIPFTTIIIGVQVSALDPSLEHAARDCGATDIEVFRDVTFPLLWPGIMSAGIFAFLLSWGNFYITYSLIGTQQTLPTFVFSGIATGSSPLYPALASIIFITAMALIMVAEMLRRRASRRLSSR